MADADHTAPRLDAPRETTFWVLTALRDQPRHGYAILQAIYAASDGHVQPGVGNLYTMLRCLQAKGLIAVERTEQQRGLTRTVYRLTEHGAQAHAAVCQRMERMLRAAASRQENGRG